MSISYASMVQYVLDMDREGRSKRAGQFRRDHRNRNHSLATSQQDTDGRRAAYSSRGDGRSPVRAGTGGRMEGGVCCPVGLSKTRALHQRQIISSPLYRENIHLEAEVPACSARVERSGVEWSGAEQRVSYSIAGSSRRPSVSLPHRISLAHVTALILTRYISVTLSLSNRPPHAKMGVGNKQVEIKS